MNKIYNLHAIQRNGNILFSQLFPLFSKSKMIKIILRILIIFYDLNTIDPYNPLIAKEYETDRNEFNRKAKE